MRQSVAAAALVRRAAPSGEEWLVNWNPSWAAFHLIGGSVEAGESFRACCEREVVEELGLAPGADFRVAAEPAAHLEYVAESRRSGTTTAYTIELFNVELLTAVARAKVGADPACRWVTAHEIREKRTADGRAVSPTSEHLFGLAGLLPTATDPAR